MPVNNISQPVTPRPLGDTGGVDRTQQGRIGDRSVAVQGGGQARAAETRSFSQGVTNLFNHVIRELTGADRRAAPPRYADMSQGDQQQVRDRMGEQARNALNAFSHGGGERVKVAGGAKALARLAEAAVPLKGDANANNVLRTVLDTAVSSLGTKAQLAALRGLRSDQGANVMGRLTENPEANKALIMLEQALVSRLTDGAWQDTVGKATLALCNGLEEARHGTGNAFQAGVQRQDDPHAQSLARDAFDAAQAALRRHCSDMKSLGLKNLSIDEENAFVAAESLSLLAATGSDPTAPIDPIMLKGLAADHFSSLSGTAAMRRPTLRLMRRASRSMANWTRVLRL